MAGDAQWTSERQLPMSVQSEWGKYRRWRRVVELWRETGEISASLMGIQKRLNSQQYTSNNPLHSSLQERGGKLFECLHVVLRRVSQLSSSIRRTRSPNLGGHDYRKPWNRQHEILMLKVNLYDVPDCFKLGSSWEESGTTHHLLGPKASEASGGSSSRRTLSKRKSTRGFCAWIWLKSLEMKYLLSALRTTGSFTRSLIEWFRPHVSGEVALGFQTVFQGMSCESHWYRDIMGQFFFSEVPFLSQSTKLQKRHRNYQTWPALNIQLCHLMFQRRLFLILIFFWKEGLLFHCVS